VHAAPPPVSCVRLAQCARCHVVFVQLFDEFDKHNQQSSALRKECAKLRAGKDAFKVGVCKVVQELRDMAAQLDCLKDAPAAALEQDTYACTSATCT
jgi:uncharacterized protein YhaN